MRKILSRLWPSMTVSWCCWSREITQKKTVGGGEVGRSQVCGGWSAGCFVLLVWSRSSSLLASLRMLFALQAALLGCRRLAFIASKSRTPPPANIYYLWPWNIQGGCRKTPKLSESRLFEAQYQGGLRLPEKVPRDMGYHRVQMVRVPVSNPIHTNP